MAGIGCIARMEFGKRMDIGYDSDTFKYTSPNDDENFDRINEMEVLSLTVIEYQTYDFTPSAIV